MPTISDLPTEIIVKISRDLTTEELGNLRLASKRTEAAVFKPFAREFFHKKQFMLTEPSLQALIDISEHPQFGPELSHLVIGLDRYPALGHSQNRPGTDEQKVAGVLATSSQIALLSGGVARDMLAHAFARLPGLDTVGIRDFCSHSRTRDRGTWRSYGSTTVAKDMGLNMTMHWTGGLGGPVRGEQYLTGNMAFATVVQALGQAGRTGVGVEAILRGAMGPLPDSAFVLHPFSLGRTLPVVSSMKKLHVDVNLATTHFPDQTMSDPSGNYKDRWMRASHLQIFLSRASNLEWLRLNLYDCTLLRTQRFLAWFALPSSVPAPVHFAAPLKQLDLGQISVSRPVYWNAFRKFRDTLEGLSIWNSTMQIDQAQYDDRVDGWTQLFKQLANLPRLRDVTLGRLRVKPIYHGKTCDISAPLEIGDSADRREVHYKGDNTADFLKKLASHASLDWKSLKPLHALASDDEDHDEEDEDDEDEYDEEIDEDDDDDAMDEEES